MTIMNTVVVCKDTCSKMGNLGQKISIKKANST